MSIVLIWIFAIIIRPTRLYAQVGKRQCRQERRDASENKGARTTLHDYDGGSHGLCDVRQASS